MYSICNFEGYASDTHALISSPTVLSRFVRNEFNVENRSTIGVESATRILTVDDTKLKAQVWDTGARGYDPPAGRLQYRTITAACVPFLFSCFIVAFALPTAETLGYHVSSRFYRGALGALLIYDVTNSSSFGNLKTWVEELREHASPHIVAMVVGNKSDLEALRVIPTEVAAEFASAF